MSELTTNPRVVAIVVALKQLHARGVKGCGKNLQTAEAQGMVDGTITFEDVAKARGIEPWLLAAAWSYEYYNLTGNIALPVDENRNTPRKLQ